MVSYRHIFLLLKAMKSSLITRGGHDKLVAELQHLWHEERPEITKKVNWAASLGDRSENADFYK